MNKTFLKLAFRDIKLNISRFLSILLIIAIGTAFFIGIKVTRPDMLKSADAYFDETHLMDIEGYSSVGFGVEDQSEIEKIPGVLQVELGYTLDGTLDLDNGSHVVRIYSYQDANFLNQPSLIRGSLPQASHECAIEQNTLTHVNMAINQEITVKTNEESITCRVVGIVNSSRYLSKDRGTSTLGSGHVDAFMFLYEGDFTLPRYSQIYITVEGAKEQEAYSKAYQALVAPVKAEIIQKGLEKTVVDPSIHWVILDRNDNPGAVDYENSADRMDAISQVFPVIFIFVALLICFTSMARLVEEERGFIGTAKSLGYHRGHIMFKYILFAGLASLLGGCLGITIGFTLFPSILFHAYSILYTLPHFIRTFDGFFATYSLVVGLLVTVGAAVLVLYESLNENSATLMRPKAPKIGKKVLLEKIPFIWRQLKFSQKVTVRNLLRYKSRFYMTVIGIAGCSALLLVGFGLKDAIRTIGTEQFGEIYRYQMSVSVTQVDDSLLSLIRNEPQFEGILPFYTKGMDVSANGVTKSIELIVPSETENMNDYIQLRERVSQKPIELEDTGVVLTEKLATMLKVHVGDTIEIGSQTVTVSNITENYLLHNVYLSKTVYASLFGAPPQENLVTVRLKNMTEQEQNSLASLLLTQNSVLNVQFSTQRLNTFNDMIESINYIVLVLIVSAGLLSFIVLYTLTNINVSERTREIATIKVLGFYDHEVASYVYRENILLTLFGILLGLLGGTYLTHFIVTTAEVEMVMFGRKIFLLSYVYAGALTLLFSLFVNGVMMRVLRNIHMVEALKSVE